MGGIIRMQTYLVDLEVDSVVAVHLDVVGLLNFEPFRLFPPILSVGRLMWVLHIDWNRSGISP